MIIQSLDEVRDVEIAIGLFSSNDLRFCGLNSHDLNEITFNLYKGEKNIIDCRISRLNIAPGNYYLNCLIRKRDGQIVDRIDRAVVFNMLPADVFGTGRVPRGKNLIYLDAEWKQVQTN
jgi:lipopolysaccharide transport system ATP-binding protein